MALKVTDFVNKHFEQNALFRFLRNNVAYYSVVSAQDNFVYVFPIPLEDLGNATLNATEKPMMLMRYIRKAIDEQTITKEIK